MVQNPMNPLMISKISLERKVIDCIVFWTKNPGNLLKYLDKLESYKYYFLFTITAYGNDLERFLPSKDRVIDTFIELARLIGKERLVWRYDPIIFTDRMGIEFHRNRFSYICGRLAGSTERCIISFLDMYHKCKRNLAGFEIKEISQQEMLETAGILYEIASQYNIEVVSCAEEPDFSSVGVRAGQCIDPVLVERLCGYPVEGVKDKNQRKACGCIESIDIGAYNSCNHICLYCYANTDAKKVKENMRIHFPDSPLLLGQVPEGENIRIVERLVGRSQSGNLFK